MTLHPNVLHFTFDTSSEKNAFNKMNQVFIVLICFSIVCFVVSGGPIPIHKSCCKNYSKHIPQINKIKKYEEQKIDSQCRIAAVKFTLQNKHICSNPKNKMVIWILKKFAEKDQKKPH
ncbi:C-C motif chemokine 28-like [Narcine bancroftii]|uniref:C-C motif chemokine 28-like n=1 Tax=Narcine bancroftii TaxID=1343680 RepID=UPI003831FB25